MKRRSSLAQVTAGLAVAPTGFSIAAANRRAGGGYSSSPDLQRRISAYVASTGVPGAQLGILKDGQVAVAAAGVLSKRTHLPASPDSVFQIGSNSKVWTATMMMQLVDAGQLDLDAPVVQYLPNFKVADGQTTQRLTVRHLVSHRSGIPGNIPALIRTGANADKLQNSVTALADIPPDVPIGVFSYSNSAFIVLGRIIEAVTGQSWEARLQSSICQPLGLDNVCTSAEQAIVHSAAVGHFRLPDNEYTPVPSWGMPPAMGPAAFIVTSAESVLRMNQLHLSGSSPTGAGGVLSRDAAAAMQMPQTTVPGGLVTDAIGLGWMLDTWEGQRVARHGGGVMAQQCINIMLPAQRTAIVLLQNAWAYEEGVALVGRLVEELTGVRRPPTPRPKGQSRYPMELSRFEGRYGRSESSMEVAVKGGKLSLTIHDNNLFGLNTNPSNTVTLEPFDDTTFLAPADIPGTVPDWIGVTFHGEQPDARYRYLQYNVFCATRTG